MFVPCGYVLGKQVRFGHKRFPPLVNDQQSLFDGRLLDECFEGLDGSCYKSCRVRGRSPWDAPVTSLERSRDQYTIVVTHIDGHVGHRCQTSKCRDIGHASSGGGMNENVVDDVQRTFVDHNDLPAGVVAANEFVDSHLAEHMPDEVELLESAYRKPTDRTQRKQAEAEVLPPRHQPTGQGNHIDQERAHDATADPRCADMPEQKLLARQHGNAMRAKVAKDSLRQGRLARAGASDQFDLHGVAP